MDKQAPTAEELRKTNLVDLVFANCVADIKYRGAEIDTRNAVTKRLINLGARFEQTPLVTVRRTAWKNALREMEWFLTGSTHIAALHPKVHSWWKPWANAMGFISNNYSKQFRSFRGESNTVDQIQYMLDTLKNHPNSRRNVITTWNTADMVAPETPITNCHGTVIQAFVQPDKSLHLTMYQRSADMVLGVPHNWIQYWALMMWMAHQTGLTVGSFTWIGGDCHVYPDHEEMVDKIVQAVNQQRGSYEIPNLVYTPTSNEFKADDFTLDIKYEPLIKESLKMTV